MDMAGDVNRGKALPQQSLMTYVVVLAAAGILPILFLSTFLLHGLYQGQKAITDEQMLGDARVLIAAADREFTRAQSTLASLRTSSDLTRGDLESFYWQCRQVVRELGF